MVMTKVTPRGSMGAPAQEAASGAPSVAPRPYPVVSDPASPGLGDCCDSSSAASVLWPAAAQRKEDVLALSTERTEHAIERRDSELDPADTTLLVGGSLSTVSPSSIVLAASTPTVSKRSEDIATMQEVVVDESERLLEGAASSASPSDADRKRRWEEEEEQEDDEVVPRKTEEEGAGSEESRSIACESSSGASESNTESGSTESSSAVTDRVLMLPERRKRARVTRRDEEDMERGAGFTKNLRTFIKGRLGLTKLGLKISTGQYDIYESLLQSLRHSVETMVFYAMSDEDADRVLAQGFACMAGRGPEESEGITVFHDPAAAHSAPAEIAVSGSLESPPLAALPPSSSSPSSMRTLIAAHLLWTPDSAIEIKSIAEGKIKIPQAGLVLLRPRFRISYDTVQMGRAEEPSPFSFGLWQRISGHLTIHDIQRQYNWHSIE